MVMEKLDIQFTCERIFDPFLNSMKKWAQNGLRLKLRIKAQRLLEKERGEEGGSPWPWSLEWYFGYSINSSHIKLNKGSTSN